MKKNSKREGSVERKRRIQGRSMEPLTIGLDLGDQISHYCVLAENGEKVYEDKVATRKQALGERFGRLGRCRIALEVGTHSPWVSRLLIALGHEVIVANARQVKLITESSRKNDKLDAHMLARLARFDPQLLRPIRHRSEQAQQHLMVIRARAALVEARTQLVNALRGLAKSVGERIPKCASYQMDVERLEHLPVCLRPALQPLAEEIQSLSQRIHNYDEAIEQIAREEYPETALLEQVSGVGTLIALTFVLTVEDPARFGKSRDLGCYVGLRPKHSESGESQPQLRITKEGDVYLRSLLVQAAHCVLRRGAPDTDLRRWGVQLFARGGKNAKKRAVVAVARKLAILLHRLWVSGEVYEPLRNSQAHGRAKARAAKKKAA
ncbi:MAG TPA: IS110 family transposase [Terriglobales bacterium]|nr:IS110 family transposase [Terriglobales bacterium]